MTQTFWRDLPQPVREREYSPSSCIGGDYQPYVQAYRSGSLQARSEVHAAGGHWHSLRYGALPAQRIELALPARARGVLVFIHGGYWQELSAAESLFAAPGCVRNDIGFAAIDYTLAPAISVDGIVAECRMALDHLIDVLATNGLGAGQMVLAGSSAGAHLAAMVSLVSGKGPPPALRSAVLVSGVFELEPLLDTSINGALGLDAASARAVSPLCLPVAGSPRTLIAWGENETSEFKRQSRDYARYLEAADVNCVSFEVAGRNHFDVILDLADPASLLGRTTLSLF